MAYKSDDDIIRNTHNIARFFAEHRQISFVLLIATVAWGWYGYNTMPKRKDPDIPVRVAVASCQWPGATAEQVEQLVSRPIEQAVAQNSSIKSPSPSDYGIRSVSFPGLALVYVQLDENTKDTVKQFSDINLKLQDLNSSLPQGAGPISFNSNFGDTAALMLTVASSKADDVEIEIRSRSIRKEIDAVRSALPAGAPQPRVSLVYSFPQTIPLDMVRQSFDLLDRLATQDGTLRDTHFFSGPGFAGMDASTRLNDSELRSYVDRFMQDRLHRSEINPDAWQPAFIRDPRQIESKMSQAAGDKYSYRDLDDFTELIQRTLQGAPEVGKVSRSGVLPEQIYLDYSQQRLAEYGLQPSNLKEILANRNITLPGGSLEVGAKNVIIDPSGKFDSLESIGNVIVGASSTASSPVYLRDLVEVVRGYQTPARYLNYLTWRDSQGIWQRSRAVTLAVEMKGGQQIAQFGNTVAAKLAAVRTYLPSDLLIVRTSDQPLQVKENIDLFMDVLYEAIILVVLTSLIGFWEWRSALLMALSIPITLAMTFGMIYILGIDIQQVSVASLIIALGLLVDDPVVAGDSIKRSMAEGHSILISSWLGPTKLASAIMFATITNIVAYLPFLLVNGSSGEFLYSLPIVMTCALLASRVSSMTFIPVLGYYILKPAGKPEKSIEERRTKGFTGFYARIARTCIEHRWKVLILSFSFIFLGVFFFEHLKTAFFPEDVQYWSYVDVWLPNDVNLAATNETAKRVEDIVRSEAERFGRNHPGKDGKPAEILKYVTAFVGGGGPRFWFSVSPEPLQLNYAEVLIELTKKEITPEFAAQLQSALSSSIAGARLDVRQLQTNYINFPVEVRISSQADVGSEQSERDIRTLRRLAGQVEDILRSVDVSARVRNDWQPESSTLKLTIDPDRANLSGITNLDVASSSTAAMSGSLVTVLQDGDKQIPVVARLRMDERAQLSDVQNLYVYSGRDSQKIPFAQLSRFEHTLETQRIIRVDHFRTISVGCFPSTGHLASETLKAAIPQLMEFQKSLPPGYSMQIGGEYDKQQSGFKNLAFVLAVSVGAIFLALLFQFNSAVKPLLVFAAAPYGIMGAAMALWIMKTPFGFMAFLGITSLIGVIVSHVIVLFDFIEEMREKNEPFEEAIVDAGIMRLRPVMITVGATVLALFPLALHGGPLWQPMCYVQIGGLSIAMFITLLLVPVLYSIFVLDLKWLRWEAPSETETSDTTAKI
jgi:multidrug efflux pump subunit AcrB